MKFTPCGWMPAASLLAVLGLGCVTFGAEGQGVAAGRRVRSVASNPSENTSSEAPRRGAVKRVSQPQETVEESAALPITSSLRVPRSAVGQTQPPIGMGVERFAGTPRGFTPKHEQVARLNHRSRTAIGEEPMMEAAPELHEHPVMEEGTYMGDGSAPDDCCGAGCGECSQCCLIGCPSICWENFSIFGGVAGFTGPPNRGSAGSFGFHEGFNYGKPVPCMPCGELGWQLGARAVQSNLSGSAITMDQRNQLFVTAGLFRRVDWGVQGGLAVDFLRESWYYSSTVAQLRGEFSWMFPCQHEFGIWFAADIHSDQVQSRFRNPLTGAVTVVTENWRPTDLYSFYYRRRFGEGDFGTARLFAGFTGEGDGLIGADLLIPFTDAWSVQSGFTYLVPNQGKGFDINAGHAQESWNIGLSIVWTPGRNLCSKSYYRPLLDVADNGSFMVDRD